MRKLNRLLLIHWYTYDRELIEFGGINFLTGKTAAGKSTIIDALQLVLLGDTNGNFFNKAANESSSRTLKSYLFGENGDDGETGFLYLRKGPFTSYVAAEFEDTDRKINFVNGFVCDCFSDMNIKWKWFTLDRSALPENLFVDEQTGVPYDTRKLKSFLKTYAKGHHEIIENNRRYQEVILGRYGSVKRKYLTLLKKAVPFSPITDIEKFITESVCDVKNNIQVEQMQSDIRQYKNLESEALRTEAKIKHLTEIAEISRKYENEKELSRQQDFIILRAREEEYRTQLAHLEKEAEKRKTLIREATEKTEELKQLLKQLTSEIEALENEYHTSDLAKKQKEMQSRIRLLEEQIGDIQSSAEEAFQKITGYAGTWKQGLEQVRGTGFEAEPAWEQLLAGVREIEKKDLPELDLSGLCQVMEQAKQSLSRYGFELGQRIARLKESMEEAEAQIRNLEKGIKPYPYYVTALKRRIESELFRLRKKAVELPVFADLLEIRDPEWRDAIEGYLDKQKFHLLVPEEYFSSAAEIYNQIRKEEKIYDAGLVDIGKLRRSFSGSPEENSLAAEIETDHPDARLYADYLLGRVIKCEKAGELNRYRTAITKNAVLYKNFVVRKLNPLRYANPFIGRKSLQIQLAQLRSRLEEDKAECRTAENALRLVRNAASSEVLSPYEAERHENAIEKWKELPEYENALTNLKREYDGLDFTYLDQLKKKITERKTAAQDAGEEEKQVLIEMTKCQEQLAQIETRDLPGVRDLAEEIRTEITRSFDSRWIIDTGEPAFRKEMGKEGRTQLTLRESFERARTRTQTIMEGHAIERRRMRSSYNSEYRTPYDIEREDNSDFDRELHVLADIRLPDYIEKIKDAKEKAYNQFRDDFIAKLKSNIESVKEQIGELNYSLKNSVFGTDRYRFEMKPRAEYRNYYDMITDPMLLDTGGWNIASMNFNQKYQKEIDSLFKMLIVNETEISAQRRAEYEKNIKKFTDYKTYLVFDLIVTNDHGEEQRLSRTLLKKSGGETQIPFYISLLASFSQVCRIRSKNNNNTIRVIILDEAFSKMDGERIRESIQLLRRFGLQAVFSAPPDKIPDIAPLADRNIAVFKDHHHSFTRYFDPAQIEETIENIGS